MSNGSSCSSLRLTSKCCNVLTDEQMFRIISTFVHDSVVGVRERRWEIGRAKRLAAWFSSSVRWIGNKCRTPDVPACTKSVGSGGRRGARIWVVIALAVLPPGNTALACWSTGTGTRNDCDVRLAELRPVFDGSYRWRFAFQQRSLDLDVLTLFTLDIRRPIADDGFFPAVVAGTVDIVTCFPTVAPYYAVLATVRTSNDWDVWFYFSSSPSRSSVSSLPSVLERKTFRKYFMSTNSSRHWEKLIYSCPMLPLLTDQTEEQQMFASVFSHLQWHICRCLPEAMRS